MTPVGPSTAMLATPPVHRKRTSGAGVPCWSRGSLAAHARARRVAPVACHRLTADSADQLAERVGFEPTELALNGFQDRRLQPLGHLSAADRV
jgi:hypothetical protein